MKYRILQEHENTVGIYLEEDEHGVNIKAKLPTGEMYFLAHVGEKGMTLWSGVPERVGVALTESARVKIIEM